MTFPIHTLMPILLVLILTLGLTNRLHSAAPESVGDTYVYPMDFAPHEETAAEIAAREKN